MSLPVDPARPGRTAFVFWGVAALFVIVLGLVHVAAQALLLAFAGILFGTALRGAALWVSARLHWRLGWSLLACVVVLIALCAGAVLWIVPSIGAQLVELRSLLTTALARAESAAQGTPLAGMFEQLRSLEAPVSYVGRAAGVLSSVLGLIGAWVFIVFVALYVAWAPHVYGRAIVRLVPRPRRERADEVMTALARALRRWMLGRIVSMSVVGLVTGLGLWILGVPLPFMLGLIAGLLGFIPNIGPIVSAVPALLLAGTLGGAHVLYVAILYLAVNAGDGYVLTPYVERRAVATPAALVLTAQLVFGAVWGILGLAFSTPLLACLIVVIRMLYVEDIVERQPAAARAV